MARRLIATLAAAAAVLGVVIVAPGTAGAGTGLRYRVVDADNAHDGGVYYRNSPHWNDTKRIPGVGGYYGEVVELVCGAWGDAVGPYANRRWHLVDNISRPSAGRGWLPDRYLNTPNVANQRTPGEPECGSVPTPSPAPPSGGAVYYSPYGSGSHLPNAPASIVTTIPDVNWKGGSTCNPSNAYVHTPTNVGGSGRVVSSLAGWSLGRVGVLYELEFMSAIRSSMLSHIKYVLIIDPGSYEELRGSCDTVAGSYLTTWLKSVPDAHLVILSGPDTLYSTDGRSGYGSAGIQDYYFNPIRQADSGGNLRSRVLVCNYTDPSETIAQSHNTIYNSASYLIGKPRITTCPQLEKMTYIGNWHP